MNPHPAATTHPWIVRLFVDVDPAGNPISRGGVLFEGGTEKATLWFGHPDPFDSLSDAWADLITAYADHIGTQPTLW